MKKHLLFIFAIILIIAAYCVHQFELNNPQKEIKQPVDSLGYLVVSYLYDNNNEWQPKFCSIDYHTYPSDSDLIEILKREEPSAIDIKLLQIDLFSTKAKCDSFFNNIKFANQLPRHYIH